MTMAPAMPMAAVPPGQEPQSYIHFSWQTQTRSLLTRVEWQPVASLRRASDAS